MICFGYLPFSTSHLELKRHMRLYAIMVPLKTLPESKSIPVFRPKRLKNHTLWGGTFLCSLYGGVPPPPPPHGLLSQSVVLISYVPVHTSVKSVLRIRSRTRLRVIFLMLFQVMFPSGSKVKIARYTWGMNVDVYTPRAQDPNDERGLCLDPGNQDHDTYGESLRYCAC